MRYLFGPCSSALSLDLACEETRILMRDTDNITVKTVSDK